MSRHILIFIDKYMLGVIFYTTVIVSKIRRCRRVPFHPDLDNRSHFLVIRPGGLGDALMAVPFLKSLRNSFPNSTITLIVQKKNKAAMQLLSLFNELIVLDDLKNLFTNIPKVFNNHFDVVLDLEPFRRISSIISYLCGASIRVGFDTNNRRLLYTHRVTYANEKNFDSLNMIKQLNAIGINVDPLDATDISFPLPQEPSQKAEKMLATYGASPDQDFMVAVAPGALKPHHRWIMSEFASLIGLMLDENPKTKVVLMGSPGDLSDAMEVLEYLGPCERVINLVGKTSFVDALGVFRHCKILVACDGGMVYMAAAMGCSTVSIWGPGVMERFKPPGENHIGVRKDYFCVPCVNYSRLGEFPDCPYERACIKNISAFDVYQNYLKCKSRAHGRTGIPVVIPLARRVMDKTL